MVIYTYSDVSYGTHGMGYAYIVSDASRRILVRRSGVFKNIKDPVVGELLAIARAVEAVPMFSDVTIHSDLADIAIYFRGSAKTVSYAAKIQPAVAMTVAGIEERGLRATFVHMPRQKQRPKYFNLCHKEARIAAGNSMASSVFR